MSGARAWEDEGSGPGPDYAGPRSEARASEELGFPSPMGMADTLGVLVPLFRGQSIMVLDPALSQAMGRRACQLLTGSKPSALQW